MNPPNRIRRAREGLGQSAIVVARKPRSSRPGPRLGDVRKAAYGWRGCRPAGAFPAPPRDRTSAARTPRLRTAARSPPPTDATSPGDRSRPGTSGPRERRKATRLLTTWAANRAGERDARADAPRPPSPENTPSIGRHRAAHEVEVHAKPKARGGGRDGRDGPVPLGEPGLHVSAEEQLLRDPGAQRDRDHQHGFSQDARRRVAIINGPGGSACRSGTVAQERACTDSSGPADSQQASGRPGRHRPAVTPPS